MVSDDEIEWLFRMIDDPEFDVYYVDDMTETSIPSGGPITKRTERVLVPVKKYQENHSEIATGPIPEPVVWLGSRLSPTSRCIALWTIDIDDFRVFGNPVEYEPGG